MLFLLYFISAFTVNHEKIKTVVILATITTSKLSYQTGENLSWTLVFLVSFNKTAFQVIADIDSAKLISAVT